MIQIFKNSNINFLDKKNRRIFFAISLLVILIGFISAIKHQGIKFGIDFAGGFLMEVKFNKNISLVQIRNCLTKIDLGDSIIQKIEGENEFLIRVKKVNLQEKQTNETVSSKIKNIFKQNFDQPNLGKTDLNNIYDNKALSLILHNLFPNKNTEELSNKILEYRDTHGGIFKNFAQLKNIPEINNQMLINFEQAFSLGSFIVRKEESVGPAIGKMLQWQAILAVIIAMIAILIYVGMRFEFRLAVAADIALLHDVLVSLGALAFLNREISIPVIAAILTLIGFSINDTIVIFDRIRENSKLYKKESFKNIANRSINETLSRTIITSLTTFFIATTLLIFGGEVLRDFSIVLVVGIIAGSYSTIYIASSIIIEWQEWEIRKKELLLVKEK
ncbi:MAG: protein translocase subunit SecF [bacterium]